MYACIIIHNMINENAVSDVEEYYTPPTTDVQPFFETLPLHLKQLKDNDTHNIRHDFKGHI